MKKTAKVKKTAVAVKVNQSNNNKTKVLNEIDNNYVFVAKDSKVNDVRTIAATNNNYEHNFFDLFASTNFLESNSCLAFSSYNAKKNICITCAVSDYCKHAKLDSKQQIQSKQFSEKVKRTECKSSMIDKIILSLFDDNSKENKQRLAIQLASEYNKTITSVKSKVQSYSCVINHLNADNIASDNDKLVKRYCSYLMNNYNVKEFKLSKNDKASTTYCDTAYKLLLEKQLI